MTRIYAQAPMEGCPGYITPEKRYLVFSERGGEFHIIGDDGRPVPADWTKCIHLNGGNWTRIEEDEEEGLADCGNVGWCHAEGRCARHGDAPDPRDTRIAELTAAMRRIANNPFHCNLDKVGLEAFARATLSRLQGDGE